MTTDDGMKIFKQAVRAALATEYQLHADAIRAGRTAIARHHLERAHILAQNQFFEHCRSH